MGILDRYIARQFLVNAALLMGALFSIIVVVDFSLNFEEFSRSGSTLAGDGSGSIREGLFTILIVLDFWWPKLLSLFNEMIGLVMVAAMGFTCAQMVKHRELTALLAGGISLHRVARPVLAAALLLSGVQLLNRELVVPQVAPLLMRDKAQAGARGVAASPLPLTADASGMLMYAEEVDVNAGTIQGLYAWERDASGLMTRRISAKSARWQNGRWALDDGRFEERPREGGPPRRGSLAFLETTLDPTALRIKRFERYRSYLSTAQLSEMIARLRDAGPSGEVQAAALERIRLGRFSQVASNLLTLMLCLPFFLRREPTGMVGQSLKASPLALAGCVAGVVGATAQIPGLPPQVSAFLPVMVLLPLAVAAVGSVRS